MEYFVWLLGGVLLVWLLFVTCRVSGFVWVVICMLVMCVFVGILMNIVLVLFIYI